MDESTIVICQACGSTMEANSPGAIALKISEKFTSWSKAESDDEQYGLAVGQQISLPDLPGLLRVEAKKIKPTLEDLADGSYYGGDSEYPQGTEFEVYIILSYVDQAIRADKMYFKKTGTADSYGEIVWGNSALTITKPKQVQVTVWA